MKFNKILITGGFGYVGSRLTPFLADAGYKISVYDLGLYGDQGYRALSPIQKNQIEWIKADIRDPKSLERSLGGIDAVIHLAAISNDPTAELDEKLTRQVNFDAVGMLVSLSKKAGVKRFINASSSSVFGLKSEENISEELEPEPLTFYSKYKMLSEWIIRAASSKDFCTVSVRPATICGYSPRQRFDLTVNKLTADAVKKKLITVHGGAQRRPNIGITDMIHLYKRLLEVEDELINGKVFNFGFENLKVLEIAQLIANEVKDLSPQIQITDTKDLRDYHICSDKILKELRYEPVSSIRKEVAELRLALLKEEFSNIDDERFYNLKIMNLSLNSDSYKFLSEKVK